MKNYTITVNGNVYDVTVEENGAGAAPAAAPKAAPKAAPAAAPKAAPKAAGAGSIEVKAGAAGKVFKIEANVGQSVQAGDPVVIIEAMKMEIRLLPQRQAQLLVLMWQWAMLLRQERYWLH